MALIPNFTITVDSDVEGFVFTETTGQYDATTNPGGYGAPNDPLADINSGVLVIENIITGVVYDDIAITPADTDTDTAIALTSLLVDGVAAYAADEVFADGKYVFTYKLIDTDDTPDTVYQNEVSKLITPALNCKLASLANSIAIDECADCSKKTINQFLEAFARYKAFYAAAVCLTDAKVITAYNLIYNYVANLKCNC